MWNIFQFLTSGLLAVVSPDASQVEYRSCSYAGVFHVRVGSNYSLTSEQAYDLCQKLFSSLATEQQIREAYDNGLDTCRYGWITDERILMVQREMKPDCPFSGTGVTFLEDAPESLSDAYCYDASVTSNVDCDEAKISAPPPSPVTAEESTAATSSPSLGDNVIEKATTEDSEAGGLETINPSVQTDTEVTPEAIEPIPEVQTPTENPEDGRENTTTPSDITLTDGNKDVVAIEVPVETTGEPTTVTKEGDETTGAETTQANTSDNGETVDTGVAITSPDNTTEDVGMELPVSEDADLFQEVNATESVDLSTTTAFPGTLEPSEVSPSEADAFARSTVSPVEDITTDNDTFTTSDSDDTSEGVSPDGKEESTTVTSLDDVPETTADQDIDLKEDFPNENNISYGLPAPRGRMGPKDIDSYTQTTPAAQEQPGTPAWLIIFSFVMVVGILLCVFAAVATKERWYGPLRQRVSKTKSSNEDGEKRAAVSLSADNKQQEMVTLMNKGQVQTNGRTEEFTVIALEEPPEKEFLA